MAPTPGDIPKKGNDKGEDLKHEEAAHETADNLRQDGLYKPKDTVQRAAADVPAEAPTKAPTEKWDPATISASTETLRTMIANIQKKYFEPDHSGSSVMERMALNAPALYNSVAANFSTELAEPFKQTSGSIQQLMNKFREV
jgi:hypothetical protein